jgi:hypothetical protein
MITTWCKSLVGGCYMCYFPQSGSLQDRENNDCDFVVYYVWIMETSCIVYLIAPSEMNLRFCILGFIASFIS